MSTRTGTSNLVKKLILGAVALVVLGGLAYGVNYLWQTLHGPSQASAQECRLAQQLFDRAKTPPTDSAQAAAWDREIVTTTEDKFKNFDLGGAVTVYAKWSVAKATGTAAAMPTADKYGQVLRDAQGHCKDSGVKLTIAPLM